MSELTDRQEEIINAAIHIFAEQSAQEFSMRKVAESVGVSEPALYRHFENKEDLLLKQTSYITQIFKAVLQEENDPGKPALEQLEEMLKHVMKNYSDRWPFTTTLYATGMFYNHPELIAELQSVIESSIESIHNLLQKGQIEGNLSLRLPSDQMALLIFGTMRLLIDRWNLTQRSFDLTEEWQTTWETLKTIVAAQH